MIKLKLTLDKFAELYAQLKNFAAERLPGDTKFKIYQNLFVIEDTVLAYSRTVNDLVKQYGTEEGYDQYMVFSKITENGKEIDNPKYVEFLEEQKKISEQEEEFEFDTIPQSIFSEKKEYGGDISLILKYLIDKK